MDASTADGSQDASGRTADAAAMVDGSSGRGDGGAVPSQGCGKTPTLWGPGQGTAVRSEWPPAGSYTKITIQSGGMARDYVLQVPENYNRNHPYRLIVGYHWYTGNAMQVVDCHTEGINCYTTQSPFYGLWKLADSSTIFVAPDGLDAGWANTNGRDVTFTDDILAQVEADLCIDKSRVFANGFSYGGAMSYASACARPNVFRAVAIYSGSPVLSGCSGGTMPVAMYLSHGTSDGTNMFAWGQQMRDHFAPVNGCTAPNPPLNDAIAAGVHTCTSYQGCSVGHPLRWCPFGKQNRTQDHTPSPLDNGASTTWNPQEVWTFLTQF